MSYFGGLKANPYPIKNWIPWNGYISLTHYMMYKKKQFIKMAVCWQHLLLSRADMAGMTLAQRWPCHVVSGAVMEDLALGRVDRMTEDRHAEKIGSLPPFNLPVEPVPASGRRSHIGHSMPNIHAHPFLYVHSTTLPMPFPSTVIEGLAARYPIEILIDHPPYANHF